MDESQLYEVDEGAPFLLNTIRVPFKLFHYLTDKLPKPNYSPLKTKKIDKTRFLQTLAGHSRPEMPHVDPHSYSVETLPRMKNNSQDEHLPKIKGYHGSNDSRSTRPLMKPNPIRSQKKTSAKRPIKDNKDIESIIEAENELDRRRENRHKRPLKKKKENVSSQLKDLLPPIESKKPQNDSILPPINHHKKVERTNEILKIYGANIHLKEDRVKNNRHLKLKKPIIERSHNNREELVKEPGYIPKDIM